MKKSHARLIPLFLISVTLISMSGCLSTDLSSSDGSSKISLAGTFYDDYGNDHGIYFLTDTKCSFVHHGEPPSEFREGTYAVKGNAVFVTLSGPWKYDLPPEMQNEFEYDYEESDLKFMLTTSDNFETLAGQPYGPRTMELEMVLTEE